MKRSFVLVAVSIIAFTLLFGCFSPTVQKPEPKGTNCNENNNCFAENFLDCKEAYGNLSPDQNTLLYIQIIGTESNKCEVYLQLLKAPSLPDFLSGLDAICKVTPEELAQLQENPDISNADCQGPLYDAMKTIQQFQNPTN